MDAMSGRCLACQADLRPDARFCPRCGQRAVAATPDPSQPPTITALASPAMQEPRPAPATRGDWDDWYTITSPGQAPPPPPYQPPPYQIPPPARQQQPYPPRELPPGSVPLQRQPNQRQPFQPPPGGPPGYEPWRPYQPGPPPAGPPRGSRRSQSNAGLWTILLLLLAGVGAGVVLLLAHPFGNHNQRQTASTGTAAASRTASASHKTHASGSAKATAGSGTPSTVATSAAEQRAASSVASMLSQSASDRTAIIGAATDIGNCGPNLNADPKVFDDAAASRQTMLASLRAMPGRDTLPPALVSDLTQAWQASIAADQAYAKWANDEITGGCVRHDTSDPGYQATVAPDRQASQSKDSFVVLWNPIASGYGLTQYSADQF
ncbi:zinc ribbon domain-containing protein [Trebonia kvetii]|uniref:Zinc ribbon domain-containing protein n=2 Tax=Trebonia kvetii TaxID=2480626 RepID=A0A6P2C6U2_9ACTN|nr:zinc ribbon domain-containing protein [Trebonia kvetii]